MSTGRRSLLKIIGAIGATCVYPFASDDLYGQDVQHVHEPPPEQQLQPRFFNSKDFEAISRIADLIIPETDTPGAVRAGVPAYIDLIVGQNLDHQLLVADGLRWLDSEASAGGAARFIDLPEEKQLGILEPLCDLHDGGPGHKARHVQFFGLMKSLTADGYYTSKTGLMDELRFRGNHVLTAYPECGT